MFPVRLFLEKHARVCGSRCLGPIRFLSEAKGQLVTISQGGCLATRDTSSFRHGLVFLVRPVKLNEKIRIRIEGGVSSRDGALRIGFTNNPPNLIPPTTLPDMHGTPRCRVVPVPEEVCLPVVCAVLALSAVLWHSALIIQIIIQLYQNKKDQMMKS
uniref:NHR domain-containing protein n=1 Tax=Electrophorus electricus TaxID=8005 RepID=A0A4W4ESZ6_ELEEL